VGAAAAGTAVVVNLRSSKGPLVVFAVVATTLVVVVEAAVTLVRDVGEAGAEVELAVTTAELEEMGTGNSDTRVLALGVAVAETTVDGVADADPLGVTVAAQSVAKAVTVETIVTVTIPSLPMTTVGVMAPLLAEVVVLTPAGMEDVAVTIGVMDVAVVEVDEAEDGATEEDKEREDENNWRRTTELAGERVAMMSPIITVVATVVSEPY